MTKNIFRVCTLFILLCYVAPCSAQNFQFDYTSLTPFQETSSGGGVQGTVIDSIYQNPLNQSNNFVRSGLPPVTTDSFVYEAGGMAELIYGDEGSSQIPPYFDFTPEHRIEAGIAGTRARGLRTGHSSPLPGTWGGDEFDMPEPMRELERESGISIPVFADPNRP